MLREAASRYDCRIHAYVLMSNHVHLLVSPETAGGVARMMQELGRAYVSTFNARHRRSGTLWEGRYKSRDDPLVHPHAVYLALGPNVTERCVAYRALFTEAIGDEQLAEIRAYVQQQRALGNDRFQRLIEAELGRCARVRPAHRPRRDAESMPE